MNNLITDEHKKLINKILSSGKFIQGKYVEELEAKFAHYIGHKYAIAVSSGSSALFLALNALKWKYQIKKVHLPAFTFIADLNAVIQNQLEACLHDVNEDFLWEEPVECECKLLVHLFGCPNESVLKGNSLILEDVAQAIGGVLNGKRLGSFGEISVYSLYPTKNLWTIGEGGIITTNSLSIYEYLKLMRNYGGKNWSQFSGFNMRLSEIQAGIATINLKFLDEWNWKRREWANVYRDELEKLSPQFIEFQREDEGHVYWVFPVLAKDRNRLYFWLKRKGIETVIHYSIPLHWHFSFQRKYGRNWSFPRAEYVSENILSLPCSPAHSLEEILTVCKEIWNFYLR